MNDNDPRARPYASSANSSPYLGSNDAIGQAIQRSQSAGGNTPLSPSRSQERLHGRLQASSADDCEGLTMMTSALLTMMDRHESPPVGNEANLQGSPSRGSFTAETRYANQKDDGIYSHSEQNFRERVSPLRPPPGMTMSRPAQPNVNHAYSSNVGQDFTRSRSPSVGSLGGYFVGGYDQPLPPSRSPPWGN